MKRWVCIFIFVKSCKLVNTNLSATNMGEEEYFSYVIEEGIYFIGCIYNGFFLKCKLY